MIDLLDHNQPILVWGWLLQKWVEDEHCSKIWLLWMWSKWTMHQCSNRPNFDVDLRTTFTRAYTFRQGSQLLNINDTIKERGVSVDIRSIIVHHIDLEVLGQLSKVSPVLKLLLKIPSLKKVILPARKLDKLKHKKLKVIWQIQSCLSIVALLLLFTSTTVLSLYLRMSGLEKIEQHKIAKCLL